LIVDRDLRVKGIASVFAAGDVACAATDDDGHFTMMSCQHALTLGKCAGYNVVADLLGSPTLPYSQSKYVTCLDLGNWGAVYTEGWNREVKREGEIAKLIKRKINNHAIYPPAANRAEAFAAADFTKAVQES
jgi:NADH dehydrogenase